MPSPQHMVESLEKDAELPGSSEASRPQPVDVPPTPSVRGTTEEPPDESSENATTVEDCAIPGPPPNTASLSRGSLNLAALAAAATVEESESVSAACSRDALASAVLGRMRGAGSASSAGGSFSSTSGGGGCGMGAAAAAGRSASAKPKCTGQGAKAAAGGGGTKGGKACATGTKLGTPKA